MRVLPVLLALALAFPGASRQRPSRNDLLEAAAAYTEQYREAFTTIVGEEHYLQRLESGAAGGGTPRRTLRSDVMLLRGIGGVDAWFFFRDVFEVDGEPVSDSRGRLEAWLRESRDGFARRARALALDQARYNLGDIVRTINVPLVALEFLLPRNQDRFRFRLDDTAERQAGVMKITYEERRRPTLIRTPDGDDVEARGTFWIEPGSGRVLRTELRTGERDSRQVRATIVVTYEPNERLRMLVPVLMEEHYSAGSEEIRGTARYSNFRRFETDARIVR